MPRRSGATGQLAIGALRISPGYDTTDEEVQRAAQAIMGAYRTHLGDLGQVSP